MIEPNYENPPQTSAKFYALSDSAQVQHRIKELRSG